MANKDSLEILKAELLEAENWSLQGAGTWAQSWIEHLERKIKDIDSREGAH